MIKMVVLQVCSDNQAALAQQRAHGQLDVAPHLRGRPEEHQAPALPVQPCTAAQKCDPHHFTLATAGRGCALDCSQDLGALAARLRFLQEKQGKEDLT